MVKSKRHKYPHRTTPRDIPDRHQDKIFPTGISSTVCGLYHYWDEIANGGKPGLTPEKFCDSRGLAEVDGVRQTFAEVYGAVQALYPKRTQINHRSSDNLGAKIGDLVRQDVNVDFVDLRAFAQFLALPTGALLLFTQCVSDERRAGGDREAARKTARSFLRAIRRVVDATENYINSRRDDEPLFIKVYDDAGQEYLADIGVLKMWADVFRGNDPSESYSPFSTQVSDP